jgi:glycosyltransferase involved in cell wall biosynthesis
VTHEGPAVSFAIPCYNESGNLERLLETLTGEAERVGLDYEIVVTDDCSTDGSWELLRSLTARYPRLRAQRLEQNSGESAASFAAIRAARGALIMTLDADLQNDPRELPAFLRAMEGADCVCGNRRASRAASDSWAKTVISRCSNGIRSRFLHDPISDAGCTFRMFRRECVEDIPFFKGVHRFLPILLDLRGFRVVEIPVANQERLTGSSHYGVFDRFDAIVDMFAVRWMKSRMRGYRVAQRVPEK